MSKRKPEDLRSQRWFVPENAPDSRTVRA